MGFGEAIRTCFAKFATFSGRARRSEYWYFMLFALVVSFGIGVVEGVTHNAHGTGSAGSLASLFLFIPQLTVTVRRLHDTGRSGWWIGGFYLYAIGAMMVSFMVVMGPAGRGTKGIEGEIVPAALMLGIVAFAIWMLVLLVRKGTNGANRYGADPAAS